MTDHFSKSHNGKSNEQGINLSRILHKAADQISDPSKPGNSQEERQGDNPSDNHHNSATGSTTSTIEQLTRTPEASLNNPISHDRVTTNQKQSVEVSATPLGDQTSQTAADTTEFAKISFEEEIQQELPEDIQKGPSTGKNKGKSVLKEQNDEQITNPESPQPNNYYQQARNLAAILQKQGVDLSRDGSLERVTREIQARVLSDHHKDAHYRETVQPLVKKNKLTSISEKDAKFLIKEHELLEERYARVRQEIKDPTKNFIEQYIHKKRNSEEVNVIHEKLNDQFIDLWYAK